MFQINPAEVRNIEFVKPKYRNTYVTVDCMAGSDDISDDCVIERVATDDSLAAVQSDSETIIYKQALEIAVYMALYTISEGICNTLRILVFVCLAGTFD